eukprot:2896881-Prymnesium_polylepis.2
MQGDGGSLFLRLVQSVECSGRLLVKGGAVLDPSMPKEASLDHSRPRGDGQLLVGGPDVVRDYAAIGVDASGAGLWSTPTHSGHGGVQVAFRDHSIYPLFFQPPQCQFIVARALQALLLASEGGTFQRAALHADKDGGAR